MFKLNIKVDALPFEQLGLVGNELKCTLIWGKQSKHPQLMSTSRYLPYTNRTTDPVQLVHLCSLTWLQIKSFL